MNSGTKHFPFGQFCLIGICCLVMSALLPYMTTAQPNLNLTSTATHSGGGSGYPNGYSPQQYNDGRNPTPGGYFGWTSGNNTSGLNAWIQFEWTTQQTFGEMTFFYVNTATRYLQRGTIQVWDGAAWVNQYNFDVGTPALTKVISFTITTTTKVRITNFYVVGSQQSNPNFHEIEIRNPIPPTDMFIVNPSSLYFQVEETAGLPASQNLAVTTIPPTLAWTTTLTQSPTPAWMGILPTTGVGATTVAVNILRTNLAAGTYNGTIGFRAPSAIPKDVPVQYDIIERVVIGTLYNPTSVKFGCKEASKIIKRITILNLGGHYGGGVMLWNATTTAPEIALITASGVEGSDLVFSVDPVALGEGTHARSFTITAKNSVSNIPASNSPFTLNFNIEIEPPGPVNRTMSVGAVYTAFTNIFGHKVAELQNNSGTQSVNVLMTPCQFPIGLARLRFVKRYFKITPSAAANLNARLYYTNTEAAHGGITNPSLLTIWQQVLAGGAWVNRGGVSDPNNNNVTTNNLTSFAGLFALAHYWTPKTVSFDLASGRFDPVTHNSILQWSTSIEPNRDGFLIERTSGSDPLSSEWEIVGKTEFTVSGEYGFSERIADEGKYLYRVIGYDKDGSAFESNPFSVEANFTSASFMLGQNYPNPFNPATEISFTVAENSRVQLVIFDRLGRIITELVNSELHAGRHKVTFDASALPGGQYFYRLIAGTKSDTKVMTVSK